MKHQCQYLLVTFIVMFAAMALPSFITAQDDAQEAHKDTIRRIIDEVWNQGNLEILAELLAPEYVSHTPLGDILGPDGARDFIVAPFRAAMPDLTMTIEMLIAEGDLTAGRVRVNGTFENDFMSPNGPIAPTGQPVTITFNIIDRFSENGQIIEEWAEFDNLGFLIQLGVLPPPTD